MEDARRRDEDARADDDPHDDADAVQQTQLTLRGGGQTGFGPEVRLSKLYIFYNNSHDEQGQNQISFNIQFTKYLNRSC